MIRVLHLVDDPNLGGINRTLDSQGRSLGEGIVAERAHVTPSSAPPPLEGVDVVVIHFTLAWRKLPFLLRLRAAMGRRRLVIVEHSYTAAYEQCRVAKRGRFRLMLRLGMALADAVVAVSEGQARWLREASIVPARKLRVIEPTSDLTPFEAVPAIEPHAGPVRLGYYGRYAPQKGLEQLVAAMALLPPGLATLAMAGYGEDEAALRQAATGRPEITIGGPLSEPAGFLAGVDAIVMPSRWEAYGQVAAETRAAGRPILVADLDGLSEQVPPELRLPGPGAAVLAERIRWLAGQDMRALGEPLRASVAGARERHLASWALLIKQMARAA